jgi:hypothetical protein
MKRTTLILDDRRLQEVKRLAAERGETISAVVDQFLVEGLCRAAAPRKRAAPLLVFDMGEPKVNLADRDQLWEACCTR